MNRDYSISELLGTILRNNFLYFRNPLPVKANSGFGCFLSPWFFFWTAADIAGVIEAAACTNARATLTDTKKNLTQRAQRTQR
jgi:hypothetical protein